MNEENNKAAPEELTPSPPVEEENFQDKYLRLLAEMDNARKRMQKDKLDMTRFATQNVLAEVLMPIDTFENALGFTHQMSEETKNWAKGFEMILLQFKEVLQNHQVTSFHSKGELFDPHKHEAVEIEETEEFPEGTILHEFLKGYKCDGRILRAARVKVAKAPTQEGENNLEEEHKE